VFLLCVLVLCVTYDRPALDFVINKYIIRKKTRLERHLTFFLFLKWESLIIDGEHDYNHGLKPPTRRSGCH